MLMKQFKRLRNFLVVVNMLERGHCTLISSINRVFTAKGTGGTPHAVR